MDVMTFNYNPKKEDQMSSILRYFHEGLMRRKMQDKVALVEIHPAAMEPRVCDNKHFVGSASFTVFCITVVSDDNTELQIVVDWSDRVNPAGYFKNTSSEEKTPLSLPLLAHRTCACFGKVLEAAVGLALEKHMEMQEQVQLL